MAPPSPLALFWPSHGRVIGFNGIPFSLTEAHELRRSYLGHSIRSDLDQAARDFCRRCARELASAIRAVSAKRMRLMCGYADQFMPDPDHFAHERTVCITPGVSTLYRVWLRGREVCATNDAALAMRAKQRALEADVRSLLSRAFREIAVLNAA